MRILITLFLVTAIIHASEKPNILLLYADDLGIGDLGCYNENSKITTPNLDNLASQGMRFTDAHSSSGICSPSRYAMLTGRHHWRDFHDIVPAFGKSVFKPERLTLPEMLQAGGYRTAAIGKWHLGWDWDAIRKPGTKKDGIDPDDFDWSKAIPGGPVANGFDHYFGDEVINFPPYCWIQDNKVITPPDTMMDTKKWKPLKLGQWECRPGPMVTGWDPYRNLPETTRRGVEYIKKQKDADQPFFLYFAFPSPHAPIVPNDEFDGKSKAGPYGDLVFETDNSIGQLLKALEDSGLSENTVVIFSADNGAEKYAWERDEKFDHWSSHPLRGLKRDIYEGGHRVPTIIRWPGVTKAGAVSGALISQIDFMATLAAAIGQELPTDAAEDSHNILPVLKGESAGIRTTHVHNTYKDQYAIRDGKWLLINAANGYNRKPPQSWNIKHNMPADDGAPVELYDLDTDIGQRNNLSARHPERVTQLQALLRKIIEQGHSAPRLAK